MATSNDAASESKTVRQAENLIKPSKARRKESAIPEGTPARPADSVKSATAGDVPEGVRERFVQVKNRYYFPDGARAFTDRGTRLTTPSENTEVIRSLIEIAKARGWDDITIRGTERFRKEAWFSARAAGLTVRGYRPTEIEQGHLVRSLARANREEVGERAAQHSQAPEDREDPHKAERETRGNLLTGKLMDHGRAPYQHDPKLPMSYFVKLETARGDRVIWGVDLERAFKESLTQPAIGDEVGLRAVRQEAVKVKASERDAEGNAVGVRDLERLRNRWIVESQGFFESREQAARTLRDMAIDPKRGVKQHPELVGTYLQVRAAELAAKEFRDPQDRKHFVAKVRTALADSVARGEPLPPVRLRDRPRQRTPKSRERESSLVRG